MDAGSERWLRRFMAIAREVAGWSKDPNKRVGCICVSPDGRQITWGFNGLPRGVADTQARLGDRGVKNSLAVHAELNALLNARRDLTGWTLVVTEAPCHECAKAMVQAGVAHVVHPPPDPESSWAWSHELARSVLSEAGVRVTVLPSHDWYDEGDTM